MNDYNVIKQIGKGSFSNVHLCKKNKNSSLLLLSGICNDENYMDELFIIKEVNLDNLVRKYVKKSRGTKMTTVKYNKFVSETKSVNITPYNNRLNAMAQQHNLEEEYYYKRLKDLIESEIEVLKKLNHENIIKYFSSDMKDQIYYIKMEYCSYGDVYSILKNNTDNNFKLRNKFNGFDNIFITKFLEDIVSALMYLHNLNIIHRDIKLHNVLVKVDSDNNFLFKLSDFGFACVDIECNLNESLSISDFDFSASALKKKYYKLCGTPYYMAPEIILNIEEFEQLFSDSDITNQVKFYDKKVDVWSYGICLYELIFNMLPFSNIYDINSLKAYFSRSTTQLELHKIIDGKKIIDDRMKILLKRLLTINPSFRLSIHELYDIINVHKKEKLDNICLNDYVMYEQYDNSINEISEVNEVSEVMKNNIIKEPLNMSELVNAMESINLNEPENNIPNNTTHDLTNNYNYNYEPVNINSWIIEEKNTDDNKDSDDHNNNNKGSDSNKGFLNSWDKINKSSSLIRKMSVDNNFMKWLLNKK